MKSLKRLLLVAFAGLVLLLTGCSGTHSTVYYDSYYDPHPHWGYGNDTTVIIDVPDRKPERPSKPPGVNPPQGSRPKPAPRR